MEQILAPKNKLITFKKAGLKDISILLGLEKSVMDTNFYSSVEDWHNEIKENAVFLIEKEGTIVGYTAYFKENGEYAHIGGLVIKPEFQWQGIGREATLYRLREICNVKRVDVVTHPENISVINLYQSLGFVIESRKENYYGDGEPRLVLVLAR